ncbi:MAG: carboxypeptidase-like regulatory domain-containing protein [Gemmatimonadetes bacterium]|nr:carboxypeptidase-like regulatory domain-containing protein [Gemmatimonadota bacterium]
MFELRLTALGEARTVPVLLDARGQPLVPLRQVLEFLQIPVAERGDTLQLEWPPGVWKTRVDLARREVSSGGTTAAVAEAEWVRRGAEVFLSPAALQRVLAAEVMIDWENVSILVTGRQDFPVVARARVQARRQGLRAGAGGGAAEPDVPYPSRSGGLAAGWGVAGSVTNTGFHGRVRTVLGGAVAGGALEGGGAAVFDTAGIRPVDPHLQYTRAFPRSRVVRQVRVGDVLSEGLVSRPLFGLTVSNEPLYAPRYFGEALIRPVVPAGWEYEVYQGEQLVGVGTRDAPEPVAAQLGYGATPVRIRMLGPAGQERTEELVFLVPATQVPDGEWRYRAGGGACRYTTACAAFGYGDVRYGVSRTLTVGIGGEHTARDSGASETRPYGLLSYGVRPDLRLEVRARAGALAHGTLHRYDRHGGWRISGGWQRQEGFAALSEPFWFGEGSAAFRGFLPGRGRTLIVQARARERPGGGGPAWQSGVVSGFRRMQFGVAYESGFQPVDVVTVTAHTYLPRHLLPMLRDLNLNGRVDYGGAAVQNASLGVTFRAGQHASISMAGGWQGSTRAPAFTLSVITRAPAAYFQTNAFAEPGRQGVFVTAGGGVAWGRHGTDASPFETLGRGGVSGRVFVDEDGDGVMGPGEQPAPQIPVLVGGERAITDREGRYASWGLLPYAVLPVGIDTLSLPVTDLAPGAADPLLRPTPNLYTPVDLPLVRTREAYGRVQWSGAPRGLAGITVEVRREGDEQPRRVVTFSDGEFYFPRLPAGAYTLTVSASSLQALRATADPPSLTFVVPAARGSEPVQIPPVQLRPTG